MNLYVNMKLNINVKTSWAVIEHGITFHYQCLLLQWSRSSYNFGWYSNSLFFQLSLITSIISPDHVSQTKENGSNSELSNNYWCFTFISILYFSPQRPHISVIFSVLLQYNLLYDIIYLVFICIYSGTTPVRNKKGNTRLLKCFYLTVVSVFECQR